MTTQTCSTCRYWASSDESDVLTMPRFKTHGLCKATEHVDSYDLGPVPSAMIVMDCEGYHAALFTLPTHSCACWEIKDD